MLHLFVIVIYLMYLSQGNREIILCENTTEAISCDNDTIIKTGDVQFGPTPTLKKSNEKNVTVNETSIIGTYLQASCNGTNNCNLKGTENIQFQFQFHQNVNRLVNITYQCEFEYYGCFKDNRIRFLTGHQIRRTNMSAYICGQFCGGQTKNYTYFGTEHRNECFCGSDSDINRKHHNPYDYGKMNDNKCKADCAEHPNEKCGGDWILSIYTTDTEVKEEIIRLPSESSKPRCTFNSQLKNINYLLPTSGFCEIDNSKRLHLKCPPTDDGICWSRNTVLKDQFILKDVLTKFIKINYTCRESPKAGINQIVKGNGEFEGNNNRVTGISVVVVSGICLICGAIIVAYVAKRRKQNRNDVKSGDSATNEDYDEAVVKYAYVQGNGKAFNKETYFSPIESNHIPIKSGSNDISKTDIEQTSSDYVYANSVEELYDVSNGRRHKDKQDTHQAIYSHTVDDVYDVSNTPRFKDKNYKDEAIYNHTFDDVYDTTVRHEQKTTLEDNLYSEGF